MPLNDQIRQSLLARKQTLRKHMDTLGELVEEHQEHVNNTNNPHDLTPSSIGLGDVANYPIATEQSAREGEVGDEYLTPALAEMAWDNRVTDIPLIVEVRTPTPISPTGTDIALNPTLEASVYAHHPTQGAPLAYRRYQIDVATGDFSSPVWTSSGSNDGPLVTTAALQYGTEYQWRVQDVDADGRESGWSPPVTFKTVSYTLLPLSITFPMDGGSVPLGGVITWTPHTASDPEGLYTLSHYEVEFSLDGTFGQPIESGSVTTPQYEAVLTLPRQVPLYVRVRPIWDGLSPSATPWSPTSELVVGAYTLNPISITHPSANGVVTRYVDDIRWESHEVSDYENLFTFDKYQVEYSTSPTFDNKNTEYTIAEQLLVQDGFPSNGTYYVRVRPLWQETVAEAVSSWSPVVPITVRARDAWMALYGVQGSDIPYGVTDDGMGGAVVVGRNRLEGGYVDTEADRAFIVKWDREGHVEWYRLFDFAGRCRFDDVTYLSNGNIVAVGRRDQVRRVGPAHTEAYMVCMDPAGNVLWQLGRKVNNAASFYSRYWSVTPGENGSFYAAGEEVVNTLRRAYIVKFSSDGTMVWRWRTGYTNDGLTWFYDSAILPGNRVVGVGSNRGPRALLCTYTTNGSRAWSYEYGHQQVTRAEGVAVLSNGDIIMAGWCLKTNDEGHHYRPWIARIRLSNAAYVWSKMVDLGDYPGYYRSVVVLPDDSIVCVGRSYQDTISPGGPSGRFSGLLDRWDSDGNLMYSKNLEVSNNTSYFRDVALLGSDRLTIIGNTRNSGEPGDTSGSAISIVVDPDGVFDSPADFPRYSWVETTPSLVDWPLYRVGSGGNTSNYSNATSETTYDIYNAVVTLPHVVAEY